MGTLHKHIQQYVNDRYRRGEIEANTRDDYRWKLGGLDRSFGNRPLNQFGPAAIDRWLESIRDLADSTRRQNLSAVRSFCRWLVAQGMLRTDPTAHVGKIRQAKRVPRTLTEDEVCRVLRAAPDARARAVLWLMVGCGLRCVEVSRLRVEDFDGRTVVVTGKNSDQRVVPVPVRVAEAVNSYLDEVGVTSGPLIRSELVPSAGLAPATLSGYVRGWMRLAGVKVRALDGRSAHALRRTCASDVADRADLRVVQQILGHSDLAVTGRHYLRPVPVEQMREAMEGRSYLAAA